MLSFHSTHTRRDATTTTTFYFNEVVFPSVLGSALPMAFPQHLASTLTCPKHPPYKVPSLSCLFRRMTSATSSIANMLLTHSLLSLKLTPCHPSQHPHFTPLDFLHILYLCWPCLTAIQHCRSYACCIDNSF